MVENQTDQKLKSLRSDNGGEYKSNEFAQFCRERGIRREFTAPHSPEQNGVAEQMNGTIQE
jgi:transposase InsO family protein